MKHLLISILFLNSSAWGFSNQHFSAKAPSNRSEEPRMFGSDVMFLKIENKGEGPIFLKYIVNDQKIADYEVFLKDKIRSSKTMQPASAVTVEKRIVNKYDFYTATFKDQKSNEEVFVGMIKKNQTDYLFILYKDQPKNFSEAKSSIMTSLASFKFH